jgi:drug/metabolite transporter (DMT)-like permease
MREPRRLILLADLMLLLVAMIWGSSYGVAKEALAFYPVLGLLALRFGVTFLVLLPTLRHLRGADRRTLAGCAALGVLLLGIFLCETFGVLLTRASNAALLISLCVVLTPSAEWWLLARRPRRVEWIAAGASLAGASLLTRGSHVAFNAGDGLMVAAACLRALTVCVTMRVTRRAAIPALTITAVQSGIVAIGSLLVSLLFVGHLPGAVPRQPAFWGYLAYMALGCTLFAFSAMNYAIERSTPTRVSLLMGSEPRSAPSSPACGSVNRSRR